MGPPFQLRIAADLVFVRGDVFLPGALRGESIALLLFANHFHRPRRHQLHPGDERVWGNLLAFERLFAGCKAHPLPEQVGDRLGILVLASDQKRDPRSMADDLKFRLGVLLIRCLRFGREINPQRFNIGSLDFFESPGDFSTLLDEARLVEVVVAKQPARLIYGGKIEP
jgi:hypothetical protein